MNVDISNDSQRVANLNGTPEKGCLVGVVVRDFY